MDATIDQLLDSYAGTGVASTTSPACTADNKPAAVSLVGDGKVSPTPNGRVVGGLTTQCKTGDFILPDNIIGSTVTIDGEDKVLDGICGTYHPDNTLACFNRYTTGADCMPIEEWDADPGKSTPEFIINCRNKPGCHGRHVEDVYPTYIVFEADHIDGEAQLRNIDWDKASGHICSITDSMKASKHILVPLGEAGKRITDNKVMALVCQEIGREFFHDASVLDPATWTINRLTRCPGGIRTKKDDDDNGPWVGAVQRQIYANPDATPPANIDDIVDKAIAKHAAEQIRATLRMATVDAETAKLIDVPTLLRNHGWTLLGKSGDNEQWQRPGKSGGSLSAHWDGKCFYCFTSSVDGLDAGQGYSPLRLLAALEYEGSMHAAAEDLKAHGKEVA